MAVPEAPAKVNEDKVSEDKANQTHTLLPTVAEADPPSTDDVGPSGSRAMILKPFLDY